MEQGLELLSARLETDSFVIQARVWPPSPGSTPGAPSPMLQPAFLSLGTLDILDWLTLRCGAVLGTVGHLAPVAPSPTASTAS